MGAYTVNNGKIYGLMGFSKSPELNDYNWSKIAEIIQAGEFSNYFKVGDTKDITLNLPAGSSDLVAGQYFSEAVSGTYKVVVLGIDHNSTYEGTNRVHFCIGQDANGKEIAFYEMKMNTSDTNEGGWAGCPMRTWLNETLINELPSDLTSVITPCTKYTDNTGGESNVEASVTATSDKLWLLSEFEVVGSESYYANQYEQNKQVQYDYFKNGRTGRKVRYKHQDPSSKTWWWLRSANYIYYVGNCFCIVDQGGYISSDNANNDHGVVPCFTIS